MAVVGASILFSIAWAHGANAAKLCCSVFPPNPTEGSLGEQFALQIGPQNGRREGISGLAVNVEGNDPGATPGDIYVVDRANNRVQQLHREPNGEGRRFVRAFGLDVGGPGVNVCTVRTACQAASASDAAGAMNEPIGIAVDQTTGSLYVTDNRNHRIDVFRADGAFEGAFGWNVDASAPAEELQFCTTNCQIGSEGGGAGQFGALNGTFSGAAELRSIGQLAVAPAGAPDAGDVVVADSTNNRVDEFAVSLNGSSEVNGVSFVGGYGWEVDASNPEEMFQTCTTSSGCQAGAFGGKTGQFSAGGLTTLAVDRAGAIYAVNSPNVQAGSNNEEDPNDPTKNVHAHVQKIGPARSGASEFAPAQLDVTAGGSPQEVGPTEIAVEPVSGEVYVTKASGEPFHEEVHILRFDSVGNFLDVSPPGELGIVPYNTVFSLALDYASGDLYLSSTFEGQRIHQLVDICCPPIAVTGENGPGADFSLRVLEGSVNPEGLMLTACRFEYGTTTAYGSSTPCQQSLAKIGQGTVEKALSAETEPLEPDTTYHYRLIAENGGPLGLGEDRTFTTGGAPEDSCTNATRRAEQGVAALLLPACMALEMVSPPHKNSQPAASPNVSADGGRVSFISQAALGEDPAPLFGTGPVTAVATRGEGGWTSESTVPKRQFQGLWEVENLRRPSFTPDFSRWFGIGSTEAQLQRATGQAYDAGVGGFFQPLSEPLVPLSYAGQPNFLVRVTQFQGASADHSHLYFRPGPRSEGPAATYLPGDPALSDPGVEPGNVYLARVDGSGQPALELLQRDSAGKAWGGNCGARLGGIGSVRTTGLPAPNGNRNQGAISPDGSRTYFSARAAQPQSGSCEESSKLRILERLETPSGPQIEPLFSSECDRVSPPCATTDGDDLYQGASVDGNRVYFTTNRQLADSDLDGTSAECSVLAAVPGCDLYLYDRSKPSAERLVQVSAGEELGAGVHETGKEASVYNGITAISADGSHVYFVATGMLTDQPNPQGDTPQAGQPNLYLWGTGSEQVSFIGTLAAPLSPEKGEFGDAIHSEQGNGLWGGQGTWNNNAYPVPATGSGDGHILLFESRAELTANDRDGEHLDVYRYDAEDPDLTCISCAPGSADKAPVDVDDRGEFSVPGTDFAESRRWVSEDGEEVGFMTPEGLLPGDVNGAKDGYLWRGGTLSRLPGKPFGAAKAIVGSDGPFLSHDGSTVAFATATALLPLDGDTTGDVYVARIDGGFPNPAKPNPCQPGSDCQQPSPSSPPLPQAASKLPGPGNPPKRCRRGTAPRKGRCVARHRRHNRGRHRGRGNGGKQRAGR